MPQIAYSVQNLVSNYQHQWYQLQRQMQSVNPSDLDSYARSNIKNTLLNFLSSINRSISDIRSSLGTCESNISNCRNAISRYESERSRISYATGVSESEKWSAYSKIDNEISRIRSQLSDLNMDASAARSGLSTLERIKNDAQSWCYRI